MLYFQQNTTIKQEQKHFADINKHIEALLNSASGHQGNHKAHQAGNQNEADVPYLIPMGDPMGVYFG